MYVVVRCEEGLLPLLLVGAVPATATGGGSGDAEVATERN